MSDDTQYSLPGVDDPASTESGVLLLGLDAERLLAGLGVAALADDPAQVALVVDYVRHGAPARLSMDALIATGVRRWVATRAALAVANDPPSASPRRSWTQLFHTLNALDLGDVGPATRAYLTACWLRREDVDRHVAGRRDHREEPSDDIPAVAAD